MRMLGVRVDRGISDLHGSASMLRERTPGLAARAVVVAPARIAHDAPALALPADCLHGVPARAAIQ